MKYIWICCRDICDSIGKRSLIGRKILFIVVMPEGIATFLFSTKIYVNNLVYPKNILLRWLLPSIRAPPFDLKIHQFQSNGGYLFWLTTITGSLLNLLINGNSSEKNIRKQECLMRQSRRSIFLI